MAEWKPSCFDSAEQFDAWLTLEAAAPVQPRAGDPTPNFCQDCNPRRRDAMLSQNRCLYPLTEFALVRESPAGTLPTDREVVGYWGAIPLTADFSPAVAKRLRAAKLGSDPSASRTPQPPPGSSPPTTEHQPWSGCRLPSDVLPSTEPSASEAGERDTEL
jgi:hypothetical protein